MTNAAISYGAQKGGAGDTDALRLVQYGGEVLEAFNSNVVMNGLIRNRSISGGKTAQFPAFFKAFADLMVPGTELTGKDVLKNEVTIEADGLLIHDIYVDRIDEMLLHYDLRGPYAKAQGAAIARIYDVMGQMLVFKASQGAELFPGDGGGTTITESASQDFMTSGSDLIDSLNAAKLALEQKDVDTNVLHSVLLPLQWSLIANSDKNINRDFGGQGSTASTVLRTISDIQIHKSNNFMFGRDVTAYNATTNADGLVGHPTDVRRLPATIAAKYQGDLTKVRGLVFTEDAAAMLHVLDLNTETYWDARRRATLLIAEMCAGGDSLRNKCAVALKGK
ncbi:hypothetical protein [Stenotrophomonas sp. SAU14A_NAIMI4_8]|uniref:hypothetical protein n=1 Tax=Stenotrophomonas sp. SAU14A_NAIMI4_8 TaxID=2072409 RepID=UPI000D53D9FF|nr:hypothetical protein [Stenotrophomonas sp. SAU14A_NAIMI4_8]AWH32225.1 hypothetical protein C1930_04740 [Stenotrophomonas sp. SAU14A_NAIMI4_8]